MESVHRTNISRIHHWKAKKTVAKKLMIRRALEELHTYVWDTQTFEFMKWLLSFLVKLLIWSYGDNLSMNIRFALNKNSFCETASYWWHEFSPSTWKNTESKRKGDFLRPQEDFGNLYTMPPKASFKILHSMKYNNCQKAKTVSKVVSHSPGKWKKLRSRVNQKSYKKFQTHYNLNDRDSRKGDQKI